MFTGRYAEAGEFMGESEKALEEECGELAIISAAQSLELLVLELCDQVGVRVNSEESLAEVLKVCLDKMGVHNPDILEECRKFGVAQLSFELGEYEDAESFVELVKSFSKKIMDLISELSSTKVL